MSTLLKWNADHSAKDWKLVTPMHCAAANGHVDVIRLLLQAGARGNEIDKVSFDVFEIVCGIVLCCVIPLPACRHVICRWHLVYSCE